jgi:hypothetical protein
LRMAAENRTCVLCSFSLSLFWGYRKRHILVFLPLFCEVLYAEVFLW